MRYYTVHTPSRPRGSWRWQDAIAIYIVECPVGESPDLRRRGHRLISVIARKIAADTRYTLSLIRRAQERAEELNAERNLNQKPALAS